MMEHFEKNIKEKLEKRIIQPTDQAWEKLELILNKEDNKVSKKSSKTYLFIAASILVLVSFGTMFFNIDFENKNPNAIEINSDQNIVFDNDQETQSIFQEETQVESKSQNIKIKSQKEAIVYVQKENDVKIDNKVNEVNVSEQKLIEESKQIAQAQTENHSEKESVAKVDPNKLLMVAEYERNVEKSASQFKQMKEKFQEVKTVLNNINQ